MMMKRTLTILLFLAVGPFSYGQQIAVVSPGGATSIYTSLDDAVKQAAAGSTLYLSGGGFQINDSTKITKKLNIIGIGHRPNNDNADGNTNVSGNLFFEGGSGNSSVLGIYLSGNINIGTAENAVNSILVRFVNASSIQVLNNGCQGVIINQSFMRNNSYGGGSTIHFSNNVLHSIQVINGGVIENNVITNAVWDGWRTTAALLSVENTQMRNNILINPSSIHTGANSTADNNMLGPAWGNNSVVVTSWEDEFEGLYNGVNPTFNYHLKSGSGGKGKATDGSDIGIYGGSGFSDKALPPGPRIVKKIIADRTDASGNLPVQIEVKVDN